MSIASRGCCSHRGYLATSRCAATGGSGWIRSRPAMVAYCRVTLRGRFAVDLDRLELLLEQIKAVEAERDVLLAAQQVAAPAPAAMLLDIKGIGPEFAAILWSEGLFRHFDNRRQVASYAGLAPTPWQSGSVDRE